jgi:hypothetical protein
MRLLVGLLCIAPASWAGDKLGFEVESGVGARFAKTGLCSNYGCPAAPAVAIRVGYELVPFASLALRADAGLGPKGSGRVCGGSTCYGIDGYRSGSLLLDARVHTLGVTQLAGGVAVGVGRLVRLQCACSEQYDTHGTALPVLEIARGVRTYFVPQTVHVGIEARYSAMFNAESAGATFAGPPRAETGVTVSAVAASFVMGVSL